MKKFFTLDEATDFVDDICWDEGNEKRDKLLGRLAIYGYIKDPKKGTNLLENFKLYGDI